MSSSFVVSLITDNQIQSQSKKRIKGSHSITHDRIDGETSAQPFDLFFVHVTFMLELGLVKTTEFLRYAGAHAHTRTITTELSLKWKNKYPKNRSFQSEIEVQQDLHPLLKFATVAKVCLCNSAQHSLRTLNPEKEFVGETRVVLPFQCRTAGAREHF